MVQEWLRVHPTLWETCMEVGFPLKMQVPSSMFVQFSHTDPYPINNPHTSALKTSCSQVPQKHGAIGGHSCYLRPQPEGMVLRKKTRRRRAHSLATWVWSVQRLGKRGRATSKAVIFRTPKPPPNFCMSHQPEGPIQFLHLQTSLKATPAANAAPACDAALQTASFFCSLLWPNSCQSPRSRASNLGRAPRLHQVFYQPTQMRSGSKLGTTWRNWMIT